jgi:hypothetical protein
VYAIRFDGTGRAQAVLPAHSNEQSGSEQHDE